jgi:hypothetical protein
MQMLATPNTPPSAVQQTLSFLRKHPIKIFAVSCILLVPCFWHQRIETSDLPSHTYNAWLTQLIHKGQAPGLYLTHQWNNILFDEILEKTALLLNLRVAEKVCVSISVLLFFWATFGLVSAGTQRAAWHLIPCLMMLAYGWTFEMGFLNFYLSIGLACIGLAVIWRGNRWEQLFVLALLPFVWAAHPLGVCILASVGIFLAIAKRIPTRHQVLLSLGGFIALLLVGMFLAKHYAASFVLDVAFQMHNGFDQLTLFGKSYEILAIGFLFFVLLCLGIAAFWRLRDKAFWTQVALPLQLYLLSWAAIRLLPDEFALHPGEAAFSRIAARLTLICGIFGCVLLASIGSRAWHVVGYSLAALLFFGMLYRDTSHINQQEAKIESLVSTVPQNARVLASPQSPRDWRIPIQHTADRACIGHCFSYSNYEPSSGQFRVRVASQNAIVVANKEDASKIQAGTYQIKPSELPAWQIYQCGPSLTDVCLRSLPTNTQ